MSCLTRKEAIVLRHILEALTEKPIIGVSDVAKNLGITPPSAYEILTRLESKGLIRRLRRKGFILTDKGQEIARVLTFSHRVLEIIFHMFFGMSPECACELASYVDFRINVEHAIQAYRKLNFPRKCPHNKELPNIVGGV